MKLEKQGDHLAIDYLKRKEKVFVDQNKMTKPQVLILLYGKGDSVMIDESNWGILKIVISCSFL